MGEPYRGPGSRLLRGLARADVPCTPALRPSPALPMPSTRALPTPRPSERILAKVLLPPPQASGTPLAPPSPSWEVRGGPCLEDTPSPQYVGVSFCRHPSHPLLRQVPGLILLDSLEGLALSGDHLGLILTLSPPNFAKEVLGEH
ncbi:hypothetical protein TREES_T100002835 [Tupaia chinensis]|uniref:Uncharacterized protein n=1 Tax=Tupaia chinensis TaxID=246437 RepID=L9JBM9_TUPCH|nr:hypothetical protein TREES_T100002835 [Tupaia chinensis]